MTLSQFSTSAPDADSGHHVAVDVILDGCCSLLAGHRSRIERDFEACLLEGNVGDTVDDALIGRTLDRGYRIVEPIASGGMGRVYRAEQTTLGRSVAVKVIHPWLVADEMAVSRFVTEARAASRLQHPNSVSIHDFGQTEERLLYLVMELLRGEDLGQLLARTGPLPIPRVVDIVRQALGALDEAHALSIVHRDIKPENFFIETTRSGEHRVKLVDFGIATIRSALVGERRITLPGRICGTPEYMSPEQARGEPLDGRSDLYSVGVVLYELLTGQLPFDHTDRAAIVLAHVRDVALDPRAVAPERCIPAGLAVLVRRALSKRREDRPATARELADALEEAMRSPTRVATPRMWTGGRASRSRAVLLAVGAAAALASAPLASVVLHADAPAPEREPIAIAAGAIDTAEAPRAPAPAVPSIEVESPAAPRAVATSAPSAPTHPHRPPRPTRVVLPAGHGLTATAPFVARPIAKPPGALPRIYKNAVLWIAGAPCSGAARALACAACGARRWQPR